MRKAMSKKVGAGGRFDIFLDSGHSTNFLQVSPRKTENLISGGPLTRAGIGIFFEQISGALFRSKE